MSGSRFSRPALAAFELFFRPWMRRRVRGVHIAGLPRDLPPDLPVLLVCNHTSWWDPFAVREVQRAILPDAPMFTVMLEHELERRPYFRRLGVVGLKRSNAAGVARAVRSLAALRREHPRSLCLFFPQGRIWPSYRRPLGFQRGVELFARELAPVVVLPVALHVEALNAPSPTVFVAAAPPLPWTDGVVETRDLEARVEAQLDRILAFVANHGERAAERWPQPHQPLPIPVLARAGASRAGEVQP